MQLDLIANGEKLFQILVETNGRRGVHIFSGSKSAFSTGLQNFRPANLHGPIVGEAVLLYQQSGGFEGG
jgi:hypothetical protein